MKLRLKSRLTVQNTITTALIALAAGLLLYKLGSLVPGLAANEQRLPSVHASLHTAWNQPLLLPYTLCQLVVAAILPFDGIGSSRLPAVVLGAFLLVAMFWLLYQWYGQRLALFGTMLLATSPWLLHTARLANASILYPLSMVLLLCLAAAWHKKDRSAKLLYASTVVGALILYIPGLIWLLLCLLWFERRNFISSLRDRKLQSVGAVLLGLGLLAPLVHRLVIHWQDYSRYLGWEHGWPRIIDYPWHFAQVWQYIFVGGYHNPVHNLAGLPLVSSLVGLTFAIGLYLYSQHRKAARSRLLAALWLVGTALVSLPGAIDNALLLPVIMVLVTGGIGYLLHLWLKVFPRNPLARSFGIGLVALLVLFGVAYNLRNYYIAWPHNAETRQAFRRQL